MNNPITLTAAQAQELHTTGRLTGYREKCEAQMGRGLELVEYVEKTGDQWTVSVHTCYGEDQEYKVTPPRDTDTTYAVKEPAMVDWVKTSNQDDSTEGADWIGAYVSYTSRRRWIGSATEWKDCPAEYVDQWHRDVEDGKHNELIQYTADQMPDWAVRQHARITDIKLIIEDGELWWDFGDLEKVAI